eukprot:354670-Chlamydomonas_euryale.AAC.7
MFKQGLATQDSTGSIAGGSLRYNENCGFAVNSNGRSIDNACVQLLDRSLRQRHCICAVQP